MYTRRPEYRGPSGTDAAWIAPPEFSLSFTELTCGAASNTRRAEKLVGQKKKHPVVL
ncbi:hypothetical protein [Saccharibacillus sacchari]|uniref:Uncharacterized protein n=1 Tax=Saccharibacillus sacchari TaxID=456493 RepID=A0ACC6PFH1_9BACL